MALATSESDNAGAQQLLSQTRRMTGDNPLLQATLKTIH